MNENKSETNASHLDVNYESIYRYLRRFCDDESLIWGAIAEAWLRLDKSLDVPQQASYVRICALGTLKDEWKYQKKNIIMSHLDAEKSITDDESVNSFVNTIEYQHFQIADSDKELTLRVLEHTPPELRKPVALVMHGIFENQVGKMSFSVDAVRHFLHSVGYVSQTTSLIEVARRTRNIILNEWGVL